ncbi:MAG: acyloxyacyl hydrolase [Bacteroidetes bacterium]|nr:acyloxyacyl hydrolase [Bacteroidota bacterium]
MLKPRKRIFLRKSLLMLITLMTIGAFPFSSSAQYDHKLFTSNIILEAKVHYGFLYAQHLELELFNSHFPAFEFSIEQLTYGRQRWERAYNYPILGMTFFYSPLGNNPILGSSFALMPFINFPLYKTKVFTFGFRFALGLGYLTKTFDRISNYKDIAIGSHLNAAINLMIEARYRLSEYFTLTAGLSLQHFSNGSLKTPNYGLNAPLVNIGLAFRPVRDNKDIGDRYIAPTEPFSTIVRNSIEFNIGAALGYKNMTSELGANYLVYHLFENTFVQVSRKSKFGMGLDLSYDASQKKILEMNGQTATSTIDIMRPGVNAAYELILGKLGFIMNLGIYLSGKEKSNGPLYEKLCFQYDFSRNFFAHVLLKVHFGRADYIGWGIGYKFDVFYGKKKIK